MTRLARWLLAHSARRRHPLALLTLEDRVVPDGRPLPLPVAFAGSGPGEAPAVRWHDAETGDLYLAAQPYAAGFLGGVRVAAADFNADTFPDVVTGPGPGGGPHVRVLDGKTGQPLPGPLGSFWAYAPGFTGGVFVAAGDVDGDGTPDVVTGAGAGGGPHVRAFSGKSGAELTSFFAYGPAFAGGVAVATADLRNDRSAEIVTGAGPGGGPHVRAFDASGAQAPGPLGSFFAYAAGFAGGVWVAGGDVNGDGRQDLVAGPGAGGGPQVRVYNAADGTLMSDFAAFPADATGGVRVATAFVTDDPYADVVVGAGPGRVRVFDAGLGKLAATPLADYAPFPGGGGGELFVAAANDPGPYETSVHGESHGDVAHGSRFVLTFSVGSSPDPDPIPTGTVMVYASTDPDSSGGILLGSAELRPEPVVGSPRDEAVARVLVSDVVLPVGYYYVTQATYSGDATYLGCVGGLEMEVTFSVVDGLVAPPEECPADLTAAPAGGGGPRPSPSTAGGVRAADGAFNLSRKDLAGDGFGTPWGHTWGWTNAPGYSAGAAWDGGGVAQLPRLVHNGPNSLALLAGGAAAEFFDLYDDGTGYRYHARFEEPARLTFDDDDNPTEYRLADGTGAVLAFPIRPYPQPLWLGSHTGPGGAVTAVTAWSAAGQPAEVQRAEGAGASAVTESFLYTYVQGQYAGSPLASVTLRRKVGAGAWATVRTAEYGYHDGTTAAGPGGDLRAAVVKDAAGAVIDASYYRYHTAASATGYEHGLKYAFGPRAFARLVADLGANVDALTDAQVAPYADNYLEYDADRRVTKLVAAGAGCSACTGGQGEYTYTYARNPATGGGGVWEYKTVETRPDGSVGTYYANGHKQVILAAERPAAGGPEWVTFTDYDRLGRVVLAAAPSAVSGYSETYADLLNAQGGGYQYLRDGEGLVTTVAYAAATTATATAAGDAAGFVSATAVRQGEFGTAVPQAAWAYVRQSAGGVESTLVGTETRYRNADGTGGQTTSYAYTWAAGTNHVAAVTVTLPTVTAGQNGPGAATAQTTTFDAAGRPVWTKDADGFLTYIVYDPATGAVTKSIRDVDTAQTTTFAGLPSGWATPTGGGLHLTTGYETDALGRTTKATAPHGRVDYTVYLDTAHAVRSYPAWDATANAPTGPTTVWRDDRAGGYTEALTMSATPAVSGGRPTGGENVGSLQSLTRSGRNLAGQTVTTDTYFNLSGLTYSTSATFGTSGTHFDRTQQGYDKRGRPNRTVTPAGTVSRSEYDGLGRVTSEWVGTDDTPTTGFWAVTNTAGTDMTRVRTHEYDGGGVGDGNRTKTAEHRGLGYADSVTRTWFDWRGRPVAVKQGDGVATNAFPWNAVNRPLFYTTYDNFGQPVLVERYDGDTVVPTVTAGVPDRPATVLLRAKTGTSYDELGRAYRQDAFSVDPYSGSVGAYTLHTDVWYDQRGQVAKTLAPGGLVTKTAYDGAGRTTAMYTGDGGGDAGWADAQTVAGDAVLEQAEFSYDAGGNRITTTTRQRFHDAIGTGALGAPISGVPARVSYAGFYYDRADRLVATADVGTNGGTAWTRPTGVPARSDTVLVASTGYDAAGRAWKQTDPRGIEARATYDAAGRVVRTVENYVDGTVSDGDDKTTEYAYGPAGLVSLTARLTGGGSQTTQWVYGVTAAGGSGLTSNDVVGRTWWPDPDTGAASSTQQDSVQVNALGQPVETADRNGTVHTLGYDLLGRLASDTVTLLGTNVDGAVRQVVTRYDSQGNPSLITSLDENSDLVNEVARSYNGLGQLTGETWTHDGSTVAGVGYGYSEMPSGANHSRPTTLTYPDGRVVTSHYSAGLDAAISRLSSLSDPSATLEAYDYLGLGTVVRRDRPEPGVELTYLKQAGEADGDAGDRYAGLDRFGRVADQRWLETVSGLGADVDRYQYAYDAGPNRTARLDLVNPDLSEEYAYDGLNQLVTAADSYTQKEWDYDAAGNWEAVSGEDRTHDLQNRVTEVDGTPLSSDAAGNLTADEAGRTLVYDAWNRLVRAEDPEGNPLVGYRYDGLGRRVRELDLTQLDGNGELPAAAVTDLYYSAGWQVLEERVGGAATTQYVWSPVYVDALVLRDRDADGNSGTGAGGREERLYALQDANWNTTALVSTSGAVVERYAYDPFGQQTVMDANWTPRTGNASLYGWVVGFQGLRLSAASGLLEGDHRWYSPTLGRWVSNDPIYYGGGDNNLYRVEGNNPVNRVDPSGLQALPGQPVPVGPGGAPPAPGFPNFPPGGRLLPDFPNPPVNPGIKPQPQPLPNPPAPTRPGGPWRPPGIGGAVRGGLLGIYVWEVCVLAEGSYELGRGLRDWYDAVKEGERLDRLRPPPQNPRRKRDCPGERENDLTDCTNIADTMRRSGKYTPEEIERWTDGCRKTAWDNFTRCEKDLPRKPPYRAPWEPLPKKD